VPPTTILCNQPTGYAVIEYQPRKPALIGDLTAMNRALFPELT